MLKIILFFMLCTSMKSVIKIHLPDRHITRPSEHWATGPDILQAHGLQLALLEYAYDDNGRQVYPVQDAVRLYKDATFFAILKPDTIKKHKITAPPGLEEITPTFKVNIFNDGGTMKAMLEVNSPDLLEKMIHEGATIDQIARAPNTRLVSLSVKLLARTGFVKFDCNFSNVYFTRRVLELLECWRANIIGLSSAVQQMSDEEVAQAQRENPIEVWLKLMFSEKCNRPSPSRLTNAMFSVAWQTFPILYGNKHIPACFMYLSTKIPPGNIFLLIKLYKPGETMTQEGYILPAAPVDEIFQHVKRILEESPGFDRGKINITVRDNICGFDGTPMDVLEPGNFYQVGCELNTYEKQKTKTFGLYKDRRNKVADMYVPIRLLDKDIVSKRDFLEKVKEALLKLHPGKQFALNLGIGKKFPLLPKELLPHDVGTIMVFYNTCEQIHYAVLPETDPSNIVQTQCFPISKPSDDKPIGFSVCMSQFPYICGMSPESIAYFAEPIDSLEISIHGSSYSFRSNSVFDATMLRALRAIEDNYDLFVGLTISKGIIERGLYRFLQGWKGSHAGDRFDALCFDGNAFGLGVIGALTREGILK